LADKITVIFDGWSLIYRPNSPAALHLLAVLAAHPPEIEAQVALPEMPPDWWRGGASLQVYPAPDSPRSRLAWEQIRIPELAHKLESRLVHLTTPSPALFAALPGVLSPAVYREDQRSAGLLSRLRESLAVGGMTRLKAVLWPEDLPSPAFGHAIRRIPPIAFAESSVDTANPPADLARLDLPDNYILYHGPQAEPALRRLLAAWSWAAGSIGENYPLLLLGLDSRAQERLGTLSSQFGLSRTLRTIPAISPYSITWLYQNCSALFHPASVSPWGGPLRQALTWGKPVVACESAEADALLGPAAYLAPKDAARQLGAALITVIVEEGVAEQLSKAALQRAIGWRLDPFRQGLLQAYQEALAFR
jgi:Glycosyl transferases group 1